MGTARGKNTYSTLDIVIYFGILREGGTRGESGKIGIKVFATTGEIEIDIGYVLFAGGVSLELIFQLVEEEVAGLIGLVIL